ncbi:nicotinate (nicotinamide) nucleotide adenylyltransferase [Kordiimonas pumila]|uniref:Probable nicotinate-nucleotide adenylyltransferase n=1 Tax=Kordiimonas pumila TaxID=2161677 RepID=A0ABV7D7T7_9PROT|nr:nicotinate (nicotinamide) nucleotide adenylyltransferase [Kordiimonas pumila]
MRREAKRTEGRVIGLYGGSFNPAHEGHLHVAKEALKRLKLDEIWFVVSPGNPLKGAVGMAPFSERMSSISKLIGCRPNMTATDIEQKLDTVYTATMVSELKKALPKTKFIWVMGADNFVGFQHWKHWQNIVRMLPIAIFDRAGYAIDGLKSDLARYYHKFHVAPKQLKSAQTPAWTFVTIPRHPGSATEVRNQRETEWFMNQQGKET